MENNYHVETDMLKNRLYLTLRGFLTDEMMKAFADHVIREANKMQPGFSVINDISAFKPTSSFGLGQIKRVQTHLKSCGVNRLIRIVDDKNVTPRMQFTRMGRDVYDEASEIARSLGEAETLLDQ
jgi:hypothetical protein